MSRSLLFFSRIIGLRNHFSDGSVKSIKSKKIEQQQNLLQIDLNKKVRIPYYYVENAVKSSSPQMMTENKQVQQIKTNSMAQTIRHAQYSANKPIEDKISYQKLSSIDAYTISIFDGHGGSELAEYSSLKIGQLIDQYIGKYLGKSSQCAAQIIKNSIKWSYQEIENKFYEIYEEMVELGNKKIKNVGSCGITAIIYGRKVFFGNVGDSQAIFITRKQDNLGYFKANERLSMNSTSERQRLWSEFGHKDPNIIIQGKSNSYYLKGRLQPTRTLGDYYLKKKKYYTCQGEFYGPYLSCIPEVSQYEINDICQSLVIASDGIWDFMSKWQVVRTVMQGKYSLEDKPQSRLIEQVLKQSASINHTDLNLLKAMEMGERRNYHDDISVAIVDLTKL